MRFFLFELPLIAFVLAWFFGRARTSAFIVTIGLWVVLVEVITLTLVGLGTSQGDPGLVIIGIIYGIILELLTLVVAVPVSIAVSKPKRNSPAKKAYRTYQGLSPEDKAVISGIARKAAEVGGGFVADWLHSRGRPHAARAVHEIAKNL